ncbi:peptidoglycan editing factor PgeF [Granulicella sp. L46]|uniref:peptidoglycan editing factor PgeF n=1 Tax=Granulicella sp. L46 TaxID=1641865 RepID=UPI00131C85A9|nr:peptidoglycan editing factor PgeF [Granulicella sp. L46]
MRRKTTPQPKPSQRPANPDATLTAAGLTHDTRRSTKPSPSAPKPSPPDTRRRSTPGILAVPTWSAHPWLIAGFSTRQGGLSTAYAAGGPPEQNLGYTPEDAPATVATARQRLVATLTKSCKPVPDLITIRQCHTGIIQRVNAADLPLTTPAGKALLRGDALYTRDPNILLGILTADCVPVLIADTRTHAIAAFHAGWRGTLARIVERGIGTLRRDFGSRPQDLIAAIGPSIGACCFAVGEEVRHEFESQFAYAPSLFSEVYDADPIREKYPMLFLTARAPGHSNLGPQIHMDLWEANRRQLLDAGLKASSITLIGHCTACTRLRDGRRKYFSHRAEQGFTGRMLSIIGTKN